MAHNKVKSEKGPHLVHTVQLNAMITAHSSGKMVFTGISDLMIATIHSEKTRLKNLMKMMMIIITTCAHKRAWYSDQLGVCVYINVIIM